MIDVKDWIKKYESLVILENEEDEDFKKSSEMQEQLKTMRFKLTSILWGCNLN